MNEYSVMVKTILYLTLDIGGASMTALSATRRHCSGSQISSIELPP